MKHKPITPTVRPLTRDEFAKRLGGVSIAVLLPCHNEEVTIAKCVTDFLEALPSATVYVYDNNSTDRTAEVAAAGAVVRREPNKGKGQVVRRMFSDIDADVYVMADGDNTYDAASAPFLVAHLLSNHLDMVVGAREPVDQNAYRFGHVIGNKLLTFVAGVIFGNRFTDMESGYRVFSRRFVKTFPALSRGFEIEPDLNVHALELWLPVDEMMTPYRERPEGSISKLSTIKDGTRILLLIIRLFRVEKPMTFYGLGAAFLSLLSLAFGLPLVFEYFADGEVRLPTAVLASALMLTAALSLVCGLILDTVTHGRREIKRLHYQAHATAPWRRVDDEVPELLRVS